jgi:5-methylcytosine-specific restriction protein B
MARTQLSVRGKIYEVVAKWVIAGLRQDDSLFTPGTAIWSIANLNELHERFVQSPDNTGDSFMAKLGRQLGEASSPAIQLMAETLLIHFLIAVPEAVGGQRKREIIRNRPGLVVL